MKFVGQSYPEICPYSMTAMLRLIKEIDRLMQGRTHFE